MCIISERPQSRLRYSPQSLKALPLKSKPWTPVRSYGMPCVKKHKNRALTVVVDLRCRLYALKCLDDLNVKVHIQSLSTMYQQLKGMGEEISDGDFKTLILTSLPKSYRPLINMILLQNCASAKPLKPSTIMESILEEFD